MRYTLFLCLLFSISMQAHSDENSPWKLIPFPNKVIVEAGTFSFKNGIHISYPGDSSKNITRFFKERIKQLNIKTGKKYKNEIKLLLDPSMNKSGSYEIELNKHLIEIKAPDNTGLFYAMITLWQQLAFTKHMSVPLGHIEDSPRFKYRGFMLDESRHFFGKDKVKQIIDFMASFKLNTFHWHLTDDQGWRVQIKALPKLTTIGGIGNYDDPDAPARYYTQKEIKEIIQYADQRQIVIIPEIDMPGHAAASNRAYPQYSGGGSEDYPEFTFDPGNEKTYEYLNTILKEISGLFPSKYIHLGGDEVSYGNEQWNTNEGIQKLMLDNDLENLKEVEHYFMERMSDSLYKLGKGIAGWDEIIESDLNTEKSLIYWWRHDKIDQLYKTLSMGYSTVLCPRRPLYFDFVQHDSHENGRRWNGFNPMEDVYAYPDSHHEFSTEQWKLIQGIQANLWTERFDSEPGIEYMLFPRLMALAESAWTEKHSKNVLRFNASLSLVMDYLDDMDVYYFNTFHPALKPEPKK